MQRPQQGDWIPHRHHPWLHGRGHQTEPHGEASSSGTRPHFKLHEYQSVITTVQLLRKLFLSLFQTLTVSASPGMVVKVFTTLSIYRLQILTLCTCTIIDNKLVYYLWYNYCRIIHRIFQYQ